MKKITSISVILLIAAFSVKAQKISTYAGDGTFGYSGDGGNATSAELALNYGVATDASGNVYIADQANNRVRKVNAITGKISTVAGNGFPLYSGDGGNATAAEIYNPTGLAFDGSGNMYIADEGNNRIRKVTGTTITTIAGNGTAGSSGDAGPATAAELNNPSGVFVDGTGNVYITDNMNNKIRMVNTSGVINTVAGNGTAGFSGDGSAATAAELNQPFACAVTAAGDIFIADQYNNRIRYVNFSTGDIATVCGTGVAAYGGDGGLATAGVLYYPLGVTFDSKGNLYIADNFNERVREINTSGIISTVAGDGNPGSAGDGGLATAAELNGPSGVAFDAAGDMFITDYDESKVREIAAPAGINQLSDNNGVNIYPNPANNNLNIALTGITGRVNITVYNITGQDVMSQVTDKQTTSLSVSGLPSGIYIVKLQTADGNTLVRRVEVAR